MIFWFVKSSDWPTRHDITSPLCKPLSLSLSSQTQMASSGASATLIQCFRDYQIKTDLRLNVYGPSYMKLYSVLLI